ncbi:PilZ domain-containing protein [Bradyrhizobium sp. sBnM-33]|nr:PilZ domain-containing protein [Bradyrhizobium sp. sBnM-33]WOH47629.1 PilZ domain-containing protein [Bradyrhizobium sp. sBnM-33]
MPSWSEADLKRGSIDFNGGTIACLIRNQSDTGAALEVASALGVPAQFNLLIVADRLRYGCTVIWRMERLIGVKFHEAYVQGITPPELRTK